ncbi:hypothetical protein PMI16_00426 [Herbaspirillum sp. CF444]|uniref:hypothetical protein n=1 Tax=Herbaspirillum sp. CF444 TaxID=1144319 RepID=UPI0002726867|nr:hypothetical protein [Herbaspirillum sp. CF444]EJL94071.1 hypothetical protein PMI16_00426 [Herbaspirillum sp. CF444]
MRKNSSFQPVLGLRDDAHRVDIITPNGATRPILGTREPGTSDQRAGTIRQAGGILHSPRQSEPDSFELGLEQRTQTVLTHRLPRAVQDRLNGGAGPLATSRQDPPDEAGVELETPKN